MEHPGGLGVRELPVFGVIKQITLVYLKSSVCSTYNVEMCSTLCLPEAPRTIILTGYQTINKHVVCACDF